MKRIFYLEGDLFMKGIRFERGFIFEHVYEGVYILLAFICDWGLFVKGTCL